MSEKEKDTITLDGKEYVLKSKPVKKNWKWIEKDGECMFLDAATVASIIFLEQSDKDEYEFNRMKFKLYDETDAVMIEKKGECWKTPFGKYSTDYLNWAERIFKAINRKTHFKVYTQWSEEDGRKLHAPVALIAERVAIIIAPRVED